MKRHVVLIGLPGCGKTTVGRLAAETLHAGFVDIDAILARRAGKPIALIFAEQGQPAFREMERKEMEAALGNQAAIVAPGGGWAAQPGAIEGAKARALRGVSAHAPRDGRAARGARRNPSVVNRRRGSRGAHAPAAEGARAVVSQSGRGRRYRSQDGATSRR